MCQKKFWDLKLKKRYVMDIQKLKSFFMWCTIINGIFLVFSFALCVLVVPDLIYSIHGKLFHISHETLNVLVYSFS